MSTSPSEIASTPPSDSTSRAASPEGSETTAAQLIALATTIDPWVDVGTTSPTPAEPIEQNSDTQQQPSSAAPDQPAQQYNPQESQPPADTTQEPVQSLVQSQAQSVQPSPGHPSQGSPHSGQPLNGQSYAGQTIQAPPSHGQYHYGLSPQGPPPQCQQILGQPQPGPPPHGQPHLGQPLQYGVGPNGLPLSCYSPQQNPTPSTRRLGPLKPLPRGRPPPPPKNLTPPNQRLGPLKPLPRGRPPRPRSPSKPQEAWRKPPLGPAYTRGGHLLGGYNPARYIGATNTSPYFDADGKFFYLTGPKTIDSWILETTYIARALSCFSEMTNRFTGFPPQNSVQLFICETRFATAWRVLEGTISGQVWAYMRVLGYSSIPANPENPLMSPTPADCWEFAQRAASRMLLPGTPEQPQEERKRMVEEILTAQATDYPSEGLYEKGINWLRLACDSLIKQGDYALAVAIYDPIPDWVPKPADSADPAPETEGDVEVSETTASPGENQEQLALLSEPASASPVEQAVEARPPPPPAGAQDALSAIVRNPLPQASAPKKRKRSEKDGGDGPAQVKRI